jgi:hypothetical protein
VIVVEDGDRRAALRKGGALSYARTRAIGAVLHRANGAASRRLRAPYRVFASAKRRHSMCWSKLEREQRERERCEAELEAEQIRVVSATREAAEPEPEVQLDEREKELVRG